MFPPNQFGSPARRLGTILSLLAVLLAVGCGKPISSLVKGEVTHASCDFSSYAVSFKSPAEEKDFEKHLLQWCAEKGYLQPTQAELQTLQHNQQPASYKITEVKYLDPANPACSLLITYRISGENEGVVGLLLTRDGSNEALERQSALVEAQRDVFLKDFKILSRIN